MINYEPGMRCIDWQGIPIWLDGPVGHVFVIGCLLQFAVSIRYRAVHAKVIALTEYQRKYELPGVLYLFGVCGDNHPIGYLCRAGGLQGRDTFDFYDTQAASAKWSQVFEFAEARNDDACLFGGSKNGRAFLSCYSFSVNC